VPWRYEEVMRRLWPTSLELAALAAESGPGLPLFGAEGNLVGHLATLDSRPNRRRDDGRLEPLRRVAATNVERWAASL